MEIAVDPIGTGSPSVGDYIKIAIDVIKRSGYKYEIGPMGTSVELPSVEALVNYSRISTTPSIKQVLRGL